MLTKTIFTGSRTQTYVSLSTAEWNEHVQDLSRVGKKRTNLLPGPRPSHAVLPYNTNNYLQN